MNWIILVVAGLFEIGWAIGLKHTEGFTRFWPTVGTVSSMVVSIALLGVAMKSLPMGTAYTIWVGIGMVGTVLTGIAFMGDAISITKSVSLLLIVIGIVGLKVATPA